MEAQIQIRRSTAAQWISANPILTPGEPGLETDTGKGKFGDGTTHWINLQYSWQHLGAGPTGPAGGSLSGQYPNPTLATNVVGAPQIIDGGVGAAELATNSVTSVKIADLNVTTPKLADGAVTAAKLAPGGIGSAAIADGSIALADLAPATVAALKVDVLDEGIVSLADADKINFSGAGVSVGAGNGVATVTITGAPATAIIPGTMFDWPDPVPPPGYYLCDGTVKADMAGVIGTKYGASGQLPYFYAIPIDGQESVVGNVYGAVQAGWQATATTARRTSGYITIHSTFTRTGANITLSGPNHADIIICQAKAPWIPDFTVGMIGANSMRHGSASASGSMVLTAGIGNDGNTATIVRDEVITFTYHFPAPNQQTIPRIYKIIKAPEA